MAFFEKIVFDLLRVPKAFLAQHRQVVQQKFKCAAADLDRENEDFFALNQCLHLASSVVLRNPTHLRNTLDEIRSREGLQDKDPTTVVTIATLCYLLKREYYQAATDEEKARLIRLHRRFDEINWMIGPEAMRLLGIEPLSNSDSAN